MLQITTVYPRFDLAYHWPRAEIRQQVSQVQVKTEGPRLEIDQRRCWAELGMPRLEDFARQVRDTAQNTTLQAIADIAAAGDEVVERAGHFREEMIFADQARRSILESIPELTVQAAPTSRPEIRFFYAQQIDWRQGGVSIKHYIHPPTITWHLGGVYVDVRG